MMRKSYTITIFRMKQKLLIRLSYLTIAPVIGINLADPFTIIE